MKTIDNENKKFEVNLETERLSIRNVIAGDKGFLLELWTNATVTKYMGGPRERANLTKGVDESIESPYEYEYDLWMLIEKETNKLIGHCGLLEKEVEGKNEIEVIYVIDDAYWGNGYATEIANSLIHYAFDDKGLNRVIALIKPDNVGSEKVAIKCGMTLEKEIIRAENTKMYLYSKLK